MSSTSCSRFRSSAPCCCSATKAAASASAAAASPPAALRKLTWGLAIGFIATSIALTIIAAENAAGTSVVDRITDAPAPAPDAPTLPDLGGDSLLPPSPGGAEPLVPSGE